MSGTSLDISQIRIAQVGLGYWGPNLLRNLVAIPSCRVETCCDLNPDVIQRVQHQFPFLRFTTEWLELLESQADAVVIATPAATHFVLAREALLAGKHVLVEKPLSVTARQCEALVALAAERGRKLMVGHTFLYNPAVIRLKEYVQSGSLGQVYYLYSRRLNLGRVRSDVNAMWNLAPHDVSIILYLLDTFPTKVSARGACYLQDDVEDVVFMTLEFPDGMLASIHVSWLDPHKIRQMVVVGGDRMAAYDDVNKDAPLAIFDRGIVKADSARTSGLGQFQDYGQFQLLQRSGDVLLPKVSTEEPLRVECLHFIDCIANGRDPLTDGRNGLNVVRILQAAQHSLKNGGVSVKLP